MLNFSTTAKTSHVLFCICVLQVSVKFTGNRAIIGSAVYADSLDLCSWYSYDPPYFYANRSNVLRWPFVSYGYQIFIYIIFIGTVKIFSICVEINLTLILILDIMSKTPQTSYWLSRHQLQILASIQILLAVVSLFTLEAAHCTVDCCLSWWDDSRCCITLWWTKLFNIRKL